MSTIVELPARVRAVPLMVRLPAAVRLAPIPVRAVVPPGARTILPVELPPNVRV